MNKNYEQVYQVFIITTNKCNARCIMCNCWKGNYAELSIDYYINNVFNDDLIKKQTKEIVFSGGEITLRKDIDELILYAIENVTHLKKIHLLSNGFLTKKIENILDAILPAAKLKKINVTMGISLDGMGGVHDDVRKTKNAFVHVMETIALLKDKMDVYNNLTYGLQATVTSQNINEIKDIIAFAEAYKEHISFTFANEQDLAIDNKQMGVGDETVLIKTDEDKKLMKLLINNIIDKIKNGVTIFGDFETYKLQLDMLNNGNVSKDCIWLKNGIVIDYDGKCYKCVKTKDGYLGDIQKESIQSFWINKTIDDELFKNNHCNSCDTTCDVTKLRKYKVIKMLSDDTIKKVFYGASSALTKIMNEVNVANIVSIIDGDINKHGKILYDTEISGIDILNKIEYDYIFISSSTGRFSITENIIKLGVSENKIVYAVM